MPEVQAQPAPERSNADVPEADVPPTESAPSAPVAALLEATSWSRTSRSTACAASTDPP